MSTEKLKYLLFFFLSLGGMHAVCFSQPDSPAIILKNTKPVIFSGPVNSDTIIDITANAYCLPDGISTLSNDENAQLIFFSDFKEKNTSSPTINFFSFVFSVKNNTEAEINLFFGLGEPASLRLTNITMDSLKILSAGFLNIKEYEDRYTPEYLVPVKILPHAINRYLVKTNFIGSYKKNLTPLLRGKTAADKYIKEELMSSRPKLVFHSIILGGIIIMCLFMLTQFFLNKDRSYLFYSLYSLSLFLFFEKVMELDCNIYLLSQFIPAYVYNYHIPIQLLISFFYIAFIRSILAIDKTHKFFYSYCNSVQAGILILVAAYIGAMWLYYPSIRIIFIIRQLTTILSALAFFPILLLIFLKAAKNKLARILLFGSGFIFIGALIMIYLNRVLPSLDAAYFLPVTYLEVGALLEVIILGLALGYKASMVKKDKERLKQMVTETEIAALKAQMNPHFMFNCINSIDAFIQSNDKYNATLYLNKFAKLIRNVLDSSKQNAVYFTKDIDTLMLYLELEELRHENKFSTDVTIEPELLKSDYKVPPLIIQPFVENAIIHGLKNKTGNDGHLYIAVKRIGNNLEYTISDNGIGRAAANLISKGKESSYGMQLSFDRVKLFNKEEIPSIRIEDIFEDGKPSGTIITVLLKLI